MKFRRFATFSHDRVAGITTGLGLALILGLLVVPGYVVAPVLFAEAESSQVAGMLAGQVFHVANLFVLVLAAAVAIVWWRRRTPRSLWILLGALALIIIVNEFAIAPHMAALKEQAGDIMSLPGEHPLRSSFGIWHGVSSALHLVATLTAGALMLMTNNNREISTCSL